MVKSTRPAKSKPVAPRRLHLDKHADRLANVGGDPDDLLTSEELAEWIDTSTQFVEVSRRKGHGPRYVRLSARVVRYRRADIIEWLRSRMHKRTSEYADA